MEVSEKIIKLRESLGWSKNRLASEAGISQAYVSQLEDGLKKPGIDVLEKLCSALGISLSNFFSDNMPVDSLPPDIAQFAIDKRNQALIRMIQGMLNSGYSTDAIGEWLDSFMRQAKKIEKAILEKYSLQELREKGAYSGADPTPEEQEQLNKFMKKYKEGNAFPLQTEK